MPHSIAAEFLVRVVGAVICYNTGKLLILFFSPSISVEPFDRQKSQSLWKWDSLTYTKGKDRYFYAETVAIIGGAFWVIVLALLGLVVWLA